MTDSFFQRCTPFTEDMLLNELICPKCKDPISPPIYHCDKGHSFCNLCYKSGYECSLCGSKCNGGRTHHLERIVQLYTYPCKYSNKGCRKKCQIKKLKSHEEGCQTFKISCPFMFDRDCTNVGNRQQTVFHCQLVHTNKTFVGEGLIKFRITKPFIDNITEIQNKISHFQRGKKQIFVDFYMLYIDENIFQVVYQIELEQLKVAMYRISSPSEIDDRYEFIMVFYNDDNNPVDVISNECAVVDGKPYNPLFADTYVNIDVDVLKSCQFCSIQILAKN